MKPTEVKYKSKFDNAAFSPEVFTRSYAKIAKREKEIEQEEADRRQAIVDNLFNPPSRFIDPKLQPPVPFKEDNAWYEAHRYHEPELKPLTKEAKLVGVGTVVVFIALFLFLVRLIIVQ